MPKHKIGIIGFGKIAQDQHAPAIAGSPDFDLVAISNGGAAIAPAGAIAFAGYKEMLKSIVDLDAVAICTPPGPRREIAAACLAGGKHVLLEKPPAGTVTEVTDIDRRAEEAGKVVFATYHAQHNGAVKRAGDMLTRKTIKALHVIWKEDIRRWHPGQDWILSAGGFGIFDPGINALSILTRILPQPIFISAAELFIPANRDAPIAADVTFSTALPSGQAMTGTFDWRQTAPQTWSIDIETADGTKLTLADGGARLEVEGQSPYFGAKDEYPDIYRDFAQLVTAGRSKVDVTPFQLVADIFMLGRRTSIDEFHF